VSRIQIALVVASFASSLVGTFFYGRLATRLGIVAVPNERTLHQHNVPRGGGVAIALPFLVAMVVLYIAGDLPPRWFLAIFVGGGVLAVVGFIDDVVEVSAKLRMLLHVALAAWALGCLGGAPPVDFGFATVHLGLPGLPLFGLAIVWMINLCNFVDGIDGMAASGSVFISASAASLLTYASAPALGAPVAILGAAALGFLCFNWPPARLFMGDTGSALQGYLFAVFVLISMRTGALSLWTWLILMGYFVSDTTTTTTLRILMVKRWWGTHRSHAYQNLARVWQNHRRMTLLTLAIDGLWLLPLALASVHWPHQAFWIAMVALAPVVGFSLKFGPLYAR
jgi:Fuc2NAc and GlcNAc transferase